MAKDDGFKFDVPEESEVSAIFCAGGHDSQGPVHFDVDALDISGPDGRG